MRHLDEGTLQAWLDRDRSGLDAEARAEIEGHLATCEECMARLDELEEVDRRATGILSSAEPADRPIPDFESVVERSRSRSRKPRRSPWLTTAWAASLVGAIAAGWMTNELSRGGTPPGAPTAVPESVQRPAAVRGELRQGGAAEAAESPASVPTMGDRATPLRRKGKSSVTTFPRTPSRPRLSLRTQADGLWSVGSQRRREAIGPPRAWRRPGSPWC